MKEILGILGRSGQFYHIILFEVVSLAYSLWARKHSPHSKAKRGSCAGLVTFDRDVCRMP